jgi:hypothetical protein
MRKVNMLVVAGLALIVPAVAGAQVAGSTVVGVAAAEMREVTAGWSAKRQVLGQPVYNEKNEKIGAIDDIIVSPAKAVSYAIVGVGGFLGVARHDVVVAVSQFSLTDGRLVLAGGSKEALQAMPSFEYSSR